MIIDWLESCKYTHDEAIAEAESMIRRQTTGIDAVSREYAIELIADDIIYGW